MAFQRTLDQEFIDALNRLHDQPSSWWRKLVDSPDVFLAIRNNCINAYSRGMSIGKIVSNCLAPPLPERRSCAASVLLS